MSEVPHPPVATRENWLAARKALLQKEKALTKERDRVNAERRRLPMVKLEKEYLLEGPDGPQKLRDLFGEARQLIVYHFMFAPHWETGCMGCTGFVDALGDLSMLAERDTRFVLVSRAPLQKLQAYAAQRGWDRPWYSSFGSDFNYDFHVTIDSKVAPFGYNFLNDEENAQRQPPFEEGEHHGISVFFRIEDEVYHTYSVYARGTEMSTDSYALLDLTPYGRQEDFEDSPAGFPQRPTYG